MGRSWVALLHLLVCTATLVVGIFLVTCAGTALAASPAINLYEATPEGFNFKINPEEITTGPDNNLWYTDGGSDVYRMSPEALNSPTSPMGFEVKDGPTDIVSLGGALWFTQAEGGNPGGGAPHGEAQIGRITTAGSISEFTVPSSATAVPGLDGLTVGPDGNLWFTEVGLNMIGRLDPSTAEPGTTKGITEYPAGGTLGETGGGNAGTAADSIASGSGGNLWFTEPGSEAIGEMNTSGVIVNTFPTPGGSPLGIGEGSDGEMWFTEAGNRIGRITPSGQVTEFALPASYTALSSIVEGPDGNMWFTFGGGLEKTGVGCITPAGNAAQTDAPGAEAGIPEGITVGPEGAIWFTESNDHQIGRLSPVTCEASAQPPTAQPTTPTEPKITGSPPQETEKNDGTFTFTEVSGGKYECSIDEGPWQPCTSGQTFGPLAPGDHQFQVRETTGGKAGPPATYRWTVDLPKKCILRVARARVFVFTAHDKVRLVIHYTSYHPAKVIVGYKLNGSKGSLELGSASAKFKKTGVFRLAEHLGKPEMTKVRAAKDFEVQFHIPGTPGSCKRFYAKSLTIPQQISNQTVWFQSDSRFAP